MELFVEAKWITDDVHGFWKGTTPVCKQPPPPPYIIKLLLILLRKAFRNHCVGLLVELFIVPVGDVLLFVFRSGLPDHEPNPLVCLA